MQLCVCCTAQSLPRELYADRDRRELRAPARRRAKKDEDHVTQYHDNTLYGRYRRWRRYRDTVRELKGLSTRELNDLGIHPRRYQPLGARGLPPLTGRKCQRTGRGRQSPAGLFI